MEPPQAVEQTGKPVREESQEVLEPGEPLAQTGKAAEEKSQAGAAPHVEERRDSSHLLDVDSLLSAAVSGDGVIDEAALRTQLAGAVARLECMGAIQEKWRLQVEKMEEVEVEWKGQVAALEQEREELVGELELLQEDLRKEQDLAMEAGLVAEEEWRKRQEIERSMAELQRELAKQKKVAREALMCIPRSALGESPSAGSEDPYSLGQGLEVSPATLLPEAPPAGLDLEEEAAMSLETGSGGQVLPQHDAVAAGTPPAAPCSEQRSPPPLSPALAAEGGKALEDAGALAELIEAEAAAEELHERRLAAGEVSEMEGGQNTSESVARLGQEMGTLRREVLELRMKLADVRAQMASLETAKKEVDMKNKFGQVCLQLVTNARDKFEDQIAMATRHALEASQKARESDKQLFALLADIASLLKEHQVQAKNNGSTYNKYKIGKKEIEVVKEDLRQLVKYVQMKAALAEKGRQKNKTKAAADAARPKLAELRDGAAQEEEVLAELERELEEARKRTEEAEKMHSMVAAMREKERQVREHVEKEVRAVQAKMQEAEIMKQQVEALKQTEQVLARELAEEVKELKVKSLEAEEVEGRISALQATEDVIREELEAKTRRVREVDRQFPRLMGLGLASDLPPPGLLGRKPQEELAWREKRKVLEDLKVMREQLIWTQSSLLKSRQRLPELIQVRNTTSTRFQRCALGFAWREGSLLLPRHGPGPWQEVMPCLHWAKVHPRSFRV